MSPEVSVVMAVYNGEPQLRRTLDGVLAQKGVNFEFIVVNDGSCDGTATLLSKYTSRDSRIKVISQDNRGLTNGLIRGCGEARGRYIARQDSGDVSLSGRLSHQLKMIRQRNDCVMVSCGTRFVGPKGEFLYEIRQNGGELEHGLNQLDTKKIIGPSHHGSTLFRRNAYERCGGYRKEFLVAQDIDLWLRLSELGRCIATPKIGYEATWAPGSLSSRYRSEQFNYTKLAIRSAQNRRSGKSDDVLPIPTRLGRRMVNNLKKRERLDIARGFYFIGSCIAKKDPLKARGYFKKALITWPFHLKALVRLALVR